ncbi:MAG TPA: IMS domain-containing protein [Chloroflexia bacterium]|nr:IMS domain-containing protein [Chloroflexia bacterium]
MYVPYSRDAAPAPANTRRSILPVLLVAGLLLLALAAAAGYLLTRGGSTPGTVAAGCQLPANPSEEDRVKQVVCLSNEEQIKAWRDLDTEVLKGTRTGDALEENIAYVSELKQKNLYAIPQLNNIQILETKISGDTATVRTIETWSVKFYNRDSKQEVDSKGAETLGETYHLVKRGGKWLVEKLDFGQQS